MLCCTVGVLCVFMPAVLTHFTHACRSASVVNGNTCFVSLHILCWRMYKTAPLFCRLPAGHASLSAHCGFCKCTPLGPGNGVTQRTDARWSSPETEIRVWCNRACLEGLLETSNWIFCFSAGFHREGIVYSYQARPGEAY